jgi:hypothetical protein
MCYVVLPNSKVDFFRRKLRMRNLKETTSTLRFNFIHYVPRTIQILVLSLSTQHAVSP